MKRGAIVFAVVAVLLLADGTTAMVTNNQVGGDTGVAVRQPEHRPVRRHGRADLRRVPARWARSSCGSWRCAGGQLAERQQATADPPRPGARRAKPGPEGQRRSAPIRELVAEDVSFAYLGAATAALRHVGPRRRAGRGRADHRRLRLRQVHAGAGAGRADPVPGARRAARPGHVRRPAAVRAAAARGVAARRHGVPEPEPAADQPDRAVRGGVRPGEPGAAAAGDRRPGRLVPGRHRHGRACARPRR